MIQPSDFRIVLLLLGARIAQSVERRTTVVDSRQVKEIFLVSIVFRPALQSNGNLQAVSRRLKCPAMKLSTRLQLVPRARMVELYRHSQISLRDVVCN
jgi:hypothetical protein